jgi:effector-binding domain-containing protein
MRTYEIGIRRLEVQPTVVADAALRSRRVAAWVPRAHDEVAWALAAVGHDPLGPPFARYGATGRGRVAVEAGFPVAGAAARALERRPGVRPSSLPAGPAAVTEHVGSVDGVRSAHRALAVWLREHGWHPAGTPWEEYLTDAGPPVDTADPHACGTPADTAGGRTLVVQPYRWWRYGGFPL